MKTSMITFLLLLFGLNLAAQIELEQTYGFSGSSVEIDNGEFKYYVMDVPLSQCRIYNEDHSLYKSIDLLVPSGYYLYDIKYLSRNTFNSDNQIELLYIYNKLDVINSYNVYSYGLKVVNEEGNVLLSLSDGGYAELIENSDGLKLLTYQYLWNDSYYLIYTNVYALGGNVKSADNLSTVSGLQLAPNPTGEQLKISFGNSSSVKGEVVISDMNGRIVLTRPYIKGEETMLLSTESFGSGTYILNLVTEEGINASKKIVKN